MDISGEEENVQYVWSVTYLTILHNYIVHVDKIRIDFSINIQMNLEIKHITLVLLCFPLIITTKRIYDGRNFL